MSANSQYVPVDKSGNDLVTMRPAANILKMSANCFCQKALRREVPPPVLFSGKSRIRYWSRDQLQKYLKASVQQNEHGVWFELEATSGRWVRLPNQYSNNLPNDHA